MKILFCGYRDWALRVYNELYGGTDCDLVTNKEEFTTAVQRSKYDIVVCVGWSWIIPVAIADDSFVIGMHPSDLPAYAGGSPIQHQVIDGLTNSVATLFKITPQLDGGPIIDKEPYSLEGGIKEIFDALSVATMTLLRRFHGSWPNVTLQPQIGAVPRRRIKPEKSRLSKDLSCFSALELYNMIRCREDPYPNVFIEDDTGVLLIKHVEFVKK